MDKATMEYVTLGIACIGAVLGLLNTWRNWSQDRVRLLVRPSFAQDHGGDWYISLEVINRSNFSLTVTSVAFMRTDATSRFQPQRLHFADGRSLPLRLEPRTSGTALVELRTFDKAQLRVIKCACAFTACGHQAYGDRGVFGQIRKMASAL